MEQEHPFTPDPQDTFRFALRPVLIELVQHHAKLVRDSPCRWAALEAANRAVVRACRNADELDEAIGMLVAGAGI